MYKVLFVASEVFPLIKTGGLGDVAGSLPVALKSLGCDVRVLMPAYHDVLAQTDKTKTLLELHVPVSNVTITLLETQLPGTRVKVWLLDYPPAYGRKGNPYHSADGQPYYDNAARFALFSRVAALLAGPDSGLMWQPQIVHCNDWQSALTPALLSLLPQRPATVFTIHNLAYQGLFPYETFAALKLPAAWWSPEALEFYGQLSFIKGGLVFADRITTVSPTYAREIQTAEYGNGLDGLLRHRAAQLTGILNGIDERTWNPAKDPYLSTPYGVRHFEAKATNKATLQTECGLPQTPDVPLIGMVSRLVQQKGIDLLLDILPGLLKMPLQLVILGSGDSEFEAALTRMVKRHPDKLALQIGYHEGFAHRIEGGADMFLMPSRFEPCGLNQLYSLRYGTVPIVRRVGGLADTVVDSSAGALAAGTATGVVFENATSAELMAAVKRALALYQQPEQWRRLALTGMRQSYSWQDSGQQYLQLYQSLSLSGETPDSTLQSARVMKG